MRDTFYCWLLLALCMAMYFGAAVARAGLGHPDWYEIVTAAVLGAMATLAAIDHYKKR